ncbi:nuclease (RecB family) [Propionibacterium freudenreichii subsp. freudenreichii]|uniref:Nuclease (RecB family) n=2 Tax=Propionibacterium freudenreichii TaxID=1744 RepID=A0A0B7NUA0_PROFF|nr:TM0106 family RecB-like putative nuclease [Propionibacterium freudenreichii]MDK9658103.1 TM0106 family RecB-like putative nuclease [Propionibacterium freudenreichii]MDK9665706.1 TM0106 family RecB-like putative nuclease [Propionibacterium freudenreichii]CEP26236.1 nuclease (RecB family) [Propionibacterium freudenreichii subsp. freudenreichii]
MSTGTSSRQPGGTADPRDDRGTPGAAHPARLSHDPRRPIMLDSYAARSCPVKTRNRFDRTVRLPVNTSSDIAIRASTDAMQELFTGSTAFKKEVMDALAAHPDAVDLRSLMDEDWSERSAATADAVAAGALLIIAPVLPLDVAGHRAGQPDVLVLGPPAPDGDTGYYPVIIKRHRVLEASPRGRRQPCTPLSGGQRLLRVAGCGVRTHREGDLLQLAHYRRILEATGWCSGGVPVAGIIGTDEILIRQGRPVLGRNRTHRPGDLKHLVISWANLGAKRLRTFARTASSGWRYRSSLERYDHEFAFRLRIAEIAARRTGSPDDPDPRVRPIVVHECESCPWWVACKPQLNDDDLSLRIDKARLDVHEITVLRSMGISTITDLACTDVEQLLPTYLPEVQHRPGAENRLRLAAERADMLAHGIAVKKTSVGPIELPAQGYSIDLDIETSAAARVYLWGFLVNDPDDDSGPHYVSFSRFEDLDHAGERALAEEAATWLVEQLTAHPEAKVYHYSDYEVVHIRRIARKSASPSLRELAQNWTRTNFFDLFPVVQKNFFGVHGLGLKKLAHNGAGFNWRDEDPGGLNSQCWFAEAVHGPNHEVRAGFATRVLEYNEDDVRATRALRAWMRTLS